MTESSEAVRFFESLAREFDTTAELRWSFLLDGATKDQVGPLLGAVIEMGFTEFEPMADEEHEGRYTLWFAEVCVHSTDSFARRVATVEQFASREGLVVPDYAAEWEVGQGLILSAEARRSKRMEKHKSPSDELREMADDLEWHEPADPTPRHQCPCCDFVTLSERWEYLICPVCCWEDDGKDLDTLDEPSGPNNGLTLRQSRSNFQQFGACDEAMVKHVVPIEERCRFAYDPRTIA